MAATVPTRIPAAAPSRPQNHSLSPTIAIRGAPFALLPIERWIELKLASGMVAPHRLKDLADVQELIRAARLPKALADRLDPWVREKFLELWHAVEKGNAEDPY